MEVEQSSLLPREWKGTPKGYVEEGVAAMEKVATKMLLLWNLQNSQFKENHDYWTKAFCYFARTMMNPKYQKKTNKIKFDMMG